MNYFLNMMMIINLWSPFSKTDRCQLVSCITDDLHLAVWADEQTSHAQAPLAMLANVLSHGQEMGLMPVMSETDPHHA